MKKKKKKDITTMELAELMKNESTRNEDRFNKIEATLARLEQDFADFRREINEKFDKVFQHLSYIDTRVERIEKNMVHKSQFKSLVTILEKKDTITSYDAAHILYDPPERIS